MRAPLIAAVAFLAACEGTAPPPPPARTVASARRGVGGLNRGAHRGGDPPPVDSVRTCPTETFRTLARYRSARRTLHFGPLCTEVINGHFAAIMATGTPEEASDLWVLIHGDRDEVHRVRRFPVGAHLAFGRIAQGWVYLLGHGNALEDMPAGAQVLAVFPLPRPGAPDPQVLPLSPLEVGLLRATDESDLDRRLTFAVPDRDPTAQDGNTVVTAIARGGPNVLLDHLSPEGAPTLRAWQVGMFQETDYVSPQGDPTSLRVSHATALLRGLVQDMDCSTGERCVAHADAQATGATPAQVLLRMEGSRVLIAGVVTAAPPPAAPGGADHAWGAERPATEDEAGIAQALSLDGPVEGAVIVAERDGHRVMAWQVDAPPGAERTRVYTLGPGHAPRAYEDDGMGTGTGTGAGAQAPWELHLRDYDRDGGFELVTLGRAADGSPIGVISGTTGSPTVAQHRLTVRLDMLRAAYGDATVRDFDSHLRGFRPGPSDPHVACALLDHLAEAHDARTLIAATGGAFTVIPYTEPGHPLRGTPQRMARRELQRITDATELLGTMAAMRCPDLACDWDQSLCHAVGGDGERGVLWFADGGRRLAAVSRYTPAR